MNDIEEKWGLSMKHQWEEEFLHFLIRHRKQSHQNQVQFQPQKGEGDAKRIISVVG